MAQANEAIAAKLVASLSKRVTMRRFSFSQPNMRSMMLRCRYLGRSNSRGNPGLGLRFMLRNGMTGVSVRPIHLAWLNGRPLMREQFSNFTHPLRRQACKDTLQHTDRAR